jgi:pimeloyl-ACP methyl ester carboxylesterase
MEIMERSSSNPRRYGKPPFNVGVVHGGPGAGGEMVPVALALASDRGILEPIQTAISLDGQIEELNTILKENGDLPVILIGFSWGAWLSFIVAAKNPSRVKKLILIASGPFEEKYAGKVHETRYNRLSEDERAEVSSLIEVLNNPSADNKDAIFERFGTLYSKADAYDPICNDPDPSDAMEYRFDIFQSVWREGAELRSSGKLLQFGKHIACPVTAIHGDYDPHPAKGVEKPLSAVLKDFRFVLLKNCGHKPWIEKAAREEFFRIIKEELR